MLIVMILTGITGSFLYYTLLMGLYEGEFSKPRGFWLQCVGANAVLLSVSGTLMTSYFGAEPSLLLGAALWPIFVAALEPGYRLVNRSKAGESGCSSGKPTNEG